MISEISGAVMSLAIPNKRAKDAERVETAVETEGEFVEIRLQMSEDQT